MSPPPRIGFSPLPRIGFLRRPTNDGGPEKVPSREADAPGGSDVASTQQQVKAHERPHRKDDRSYAEHYVHVAHAYISAGNWAAFQLYMNTAAQSCICFPPNLGSHPKEDQTSPMGHSSSCSIGALIPQRTAIQDANATDKTMPASIAHPLCPRR